MTPGCTQPASRIRNFFAAIAPRYDLANHLLSGGFDFAWRRRAARVIAEGNPARILDLASGSGDLALALRAECPAGEMVSADFCLPMLALGKEKGAPNPVVADGLRLPFAPETFDAVTVAFGLRNMERWLDALRETSRVLRPGGRVLVLDFSIPAAPLRWIYRPYLHCVLPLVARTLTGNRDAYEHLADSIETFPSGQEMCALLEQAGFRSAACTPLTGGIVSLYTGERRP